MKPLLNEKIEIIKEKKVEHGRLLNVRIKNKKYVIREVWFDKKDEWTNDNKKVFSITRSLYDLKDKNREKSLEFGSFLVSPKKFK